MLLLVGQNEKDENTPERLEVECGEEDLLVGEHGLVSRGHLGGDNDN